MNNHKAVMLDLKEIIETIGRVVFVTFEGHKQPSTNGGAEVFLIPGADTFAERVNGKSINTYDNTFFVRIIVNEDCSDDPLQWSDTRYDIINTILSDTEVWNNLVDRTVSGVTYDDLNTYPRSTFEILFEFTIREDC